MRSLFKNLPFRETSQAIRVDGVRIEINPFQILTWVTICHKFDEVYDDKAPLVPAILDIGFNGTFCIREEHLRAFAGLDRRILPVLRTVRTNRGTATVHGADAWLHGNAIGTIQPLRHDPFRLDLPQGILIFPVPRVTAQDDPRPRLPLLGMQALHRNDLQLLIDFKRAYVHLKKPRFFFAPFGI